MKRFCPMCGTFYEDEPALSRTDGETEICPECGLKEALTAAGETEDTIDELLLKNAVMDNPQILVNMVSHINMCEEDDDEIRYKVFKQIGFSDAMILRFAFSDDLETFNDVKED